MNILDVVAAILDMPGVKLGLLPDAPDKLIALFEYGGPPPFHSFGGTDYSYNVQARTRAATQAEAYTLAVDVQDKLNRYDSAELSILQTSAILDIGQDKQQRQEYTVNFAVYMK